MELVLVGVCLTGAASVVVAVRRAWNELGQLMAVDELSRSIED